jgi:exodeoxyribonuclease-3
MGYPYLMVTGKKLVDLDYRMTWDKEFSAYLKKLNEKKPLIWCGDLNVTRYQK